MNATKQLRDEHEGVKLMLRILEKVSRAVASGRKPDLNHIEHMLEFFRVFVDKCHHGKEEDLLFPELEKHGLPKERGPIGVMLSEHDQGRKYIKGMGDALEGMRRGDPQAAKSFKENAGGYASLLEAHISKENDVLFVMADRVLSAEENEALLQGFERLEEERIGAGKHEQFHKLIDELQNVYLKQK